MNVYVVLRHECQEESQIILVFESKSEAENHAQECNDRVTDRLTSYSVEEHEVTPAVKESESDDVASEMVAELVKSGAKRVKRKVGESTLSLHYLSPVLTIEVRFNNGMSFQQKVGDNNTPATFLRLFENCYIKAKVGY